MENLIACVRIRPILDPGSEEIIYDKCDDKSVINLKTREKYEFDNVFDSLTRTEVIFNTIGVNLVSACLQGVNVCIFAYGQTSSGKTHTMKGTEHSPGIIPQALRYIFDKMSEDKSLEYEVKASYLEIYNENINDLLNPSEKSLDIRENTQKGVHIQSLAEPVIKTYKMAMDL